MSQHQASSRLPPAPVMVRRTNGCAIAALVTGLCGLAIVPIALGHLALAQIKRSGDQGTALAVVGLVLGYLAVAGYLILAFALAWFAVRA